MKNILVLTGSPRKGGNSDLMADAFIEGAQNKGHKVIKFKTAFKNIGGCRACQMCWSREGKCVLNDDFNELQPLLENSDVLVLATPLYWFSMSGQLKNAVDRLFAYVGNDSRKKLKIKESILLSCGADTDKNVFNGLITTYKETIKFLNIENKGILTVHSVENKGDIVNTSALKDVVLLTDNI